MLTLRNSLQVGGEYTRGNRNEGAYANKAGLIITGTVPKTAEALHWLHGPIVSWAMCNCGQVFSTS